VTAGDDGLGNWEATITILEALPAGGTKIRVVDAEPQLT
jgi:hypothetical protein